MRFLLPAVCLLLLSPPLTSQDQPSRPDRSEQPFDLDAAFAAVMPPTEEARWTLVPWRHSLTEALQEAKALHRPVYLYVNDGDVESGRC